MLKKEMILLGFLMLLTCFGIRDAFADLVYQQDFSGNWPYDGWIDYNPSHGGVFEWESVKSPGLLCEESDEGAVGHTEESHTANSWIASPAFWLSSEGTYNCSFDQRVGNAEYRENMSTYIWKGDPEDFTTDSTNAILIWEGSGLTNVNCITRTRAESFSPDLTGSDYHVIYYCTSNANEFLAIWDNLIVSGSPTLVQLTSFTANGFDDYVTLYWETASEIDNAGFYVWRGTTKDGTYTEITTSLIPAEGSATTGASYAYTDSDVTGPRIYYYKLEDVSTSGSRSFHGPVSAAVGDAKAREVIGAGTIDAGDTADGLGDITLEGTGTHTVTTGRYEGNPKDTPYFTPTGGYWFVDITDPDSLDRVTVHFCPAKPGETVYFWNGSAWLACSEQTYEDDCIAVAVTDGTKPKLEDLSMCVFALGAGSEPIPTLSEWGFILLSLIIITMAIATLRRRGMGFPNAEV